MRNASHDIMIVPTDDGTPMAICLGYDYCAEHEFGIAKLERDFGIEKIKLGIEGYRIKEVPGNIIKFDEGEWLYLVCDTGYYENRHPDCLQFSSYSKEDVQASWSEDDFAIRVRGEAREFIHDLYSAITEKDVAIFLKKAQVFGGSGIVLAIISRVPDDVKKQMRDDSAYQKRLTDAVEKTGIKRRLKEAEKGYYALSPRWADEKETEISFWLNPCEQHANNYGWFKLEDLEQWAKGEGRIPKEA